MTLTNILIVFAVIHASCADKRSLTFVIDNTGSMIDDIRHIKKVAKSVVEAALNTTGEIEDVLLVTFGDPDVQLRLRTTSGEQMEQALGNITAGDGGNCPEMALTGIKLALAESRPGSYLYVFTDASAKDYGLLEEIKTLCQKTQSRITFMLTGHCGDKNDEGYKVYEKIASACIGQKIETNKNALEREIYSSIANNTLQSQRTEAEIEVK